MKIAIIEDERPAQRELSYLLRTILGKVEIQEGDSGADGIRLISQDTYDMIFLDIHLGDIKGVDLVPLIKKLSPSTKIIFSTAYSEYAMQAFELQVDDYILKPYEESRLRQILERHCSKKEGTAEIGGGSFLDKICVNKERESRLIDIDTVAYIETDGQGRGCVIHTVRGGYRSNQYLSEYEKKLEEKGFFRIHKSYLVNLKYIVSIFPWEGGRFAIRLKGFEKTVLPVGREKIRQLRNKILI